MTGPLKGVKVLDLSRFVAGPYCGMLLADMGCEVIKVEKKGGEDTRSIPPFFNNNEGDSYYNASLNRNKRAITLNYRASGSKILLEKLFEWADVVIENFRPGTLEKMGFPPHQIQKINPKIIIVRCSGFGQSGPLKNKAGFDSIAQAMGGIMSLTGEEEDPPMLTGTYIIDYVTGMHAAIGVLSAMHLREKNGRGQVIDVSLYESAVSLLVSAIPVYDLLKEIPKRVGNEDRNASPAGVFKTKDGWIYLSIGNQNLWEKLCDLMGRDDLLNTKYLNTLEKRLKYSDEVRNIVKNWIKKFPTNDLLQRLEETGVPCAPIQDIKDIMNDNHLREREQIVNVNHPIVGPVAMSGITIKLSETPGEIKYGIPLIGQHNDEVYLNELGLSMNEYEKYKKNNII